MAVLSGKRTIVSKNRFFRNPVLGQVGTGYRPGVVSGLRRIPCRARLDLVQSGSITLHDFLLFVSFLVIARLAGLDAFQGSYELHAVTSR